MGRIVYAFPATGKTFLCNKDERFIELKSEDYHWININGTEENKGLHNTINKDWPQNYLNAIKEARNNYDIVFITHSGSILCKENDIHYDAIFPSMECKNEYIVRMRKRGNNEKFINHMEKHFDEYIVELESDEYPDEKIKLKPNEFLEDGIHRLSLLMKSPLLDKNPSNNNLITTENTFNDYRKRTKSILESNKINYALITFNNDYIESLLKNEVGMEIGRFYSGSDYRKIVLLDNFIVISSFLGGPNASALMEELSYYGIKHYLSVGTACNIGNDLYDCMLVEKAIRDEGTSLFYKEPSIYSYTSKKLNKYVSEELSKTNLKFYKGITWTIDAYYRENLERMKKRIIEGATSIDMESSVWCSVAESLNLQFSQILFFKDRINENMWLKRISNEEINENISKLGISMSKKIVKRISETNENRI